MGCQALTGSNHLLKAKEKKVGGKKLCSRNHQGAVQGLPSAHSTIISKCRQILKFAADTKGCVDEGQLWKETGQ